MATQTVILAEKPSVGRDLAAALSPSGRPTRHAGYLTAGEYIVTWGFGHLLTLAEPDAYDPAWKRWAWETLPMLPAAFRVTPTAPGADQLAVIGHLLARPDVGRIIVATDADREGELIARWILRHLHATQPVARLWLSENTPAAIRDALAHLKPARAYDGLAAAAEARAQADWLVGLNATRALSLRHGTPGTGTLSVGRVQTPTLALVAHRDQRIAAFRPEAFARVRATCALADGATYPAIWHPADPPDPDHPDRVPADAARALAARLPPGTPGQVSRVDTQTVTLQPPLLYSLSDLQREANQRLSLSAQETLDAAQWLYEHKATSYPRTSARHVTAAVAATLADRLQRLAKAAPHQFSVLGLSAPLAVAHVTDDAKVAEAGHYAIIPTGEPVPDDAPDPQRQVYDLIGRRLLAALSPAGQDARTVVETVIGGERFVSRGVAVITPGWRAILAPPAVEDESPRDGDGDDNDEAALPAALAPGLPVTVARTEAVSGQTKPPPRLSDASLLALMEKHGLGTPATRARVLEVMARRGYIERKTRALIATTKGQAVLAVAPDALTQADTTAAWEARLEAIVTGADPAGFVADMRAFTTEIVAAIRGQAVQAMGEDLGPCPVCQQGRIVATAKAWGCSRWREGCGFTLWREVGGKRLTDGQLKTLASGKPTSVIKGFKSRKPGGKPFSARLQWDAGAGRVTFHFEDAGKGRGQGQGATNTGKLKVKGGDPHARTRDSALPHGDRAG